MYSLRSAMWAVAQQHRQRLYESWNWKILPQKHLTPTRYFSQATDTYRQRMLTQRSISHGSVWISIGEYQMWFAYTARTTAIWHWQWKISRRRRAKHLRRATLCGIRITLNLRLNLCQVRQEKANRDKAQQQFDSVCVSVFIERKREREIHKIHEFRKTKRKKWMRRFCAGVGAFVNAWAVCVMRF